jgi:hypothetical protein
MKFPEFDFQLELPQKYSLHMPCLKHGITNRYQHEHGLTATANYTTEILPPTTDHQPKRNTSEDDYYEVFLHCRCP